MVVVEHGEIVQARRRVRMLRAERLLADRQGPLVQRLGLGVGAGGLVEPARLFRLVAVSGCSGPSAFSLIARARLYSGSAWA